MAAVSLLFPHQLFADSPILESGRPVYLVEEFLFFRQYKFHRQKLAFHRASMQAYAEFLQKLDIKVHYVEAQEERSDIRKLIPFLAENDVSQIHCIDPTDNWLEKRLRAGAKKENIELHVSENPGFLNTRNDLKDFFRKDKKKFYQTSFYIAERKKRKILVDEDLEPIGEKWSFDTENRKKYPRKKTPPAIHYPSRNDYHEAACAYVLEHFPDNPGALTESPLYPADFTGAEQWLQDFLEQRFAEFGPYEDAIVKDASILHHSVLTPMLNVGLLTPNQVLQAALKFSADHKIPINSLEGFVRQIMGWREFIRGVYEAKGSYERTRNFWGFQRKIPLSFYEGTTGIEPLDHTIKKVLRTGYCHHIERLMVLGNFMILCEFDPDEVYRWFMELFIDAYDWVMVPNVYGMSQFADGGLMATKPYISGSNYLNKMSDYKSGDWEAVWDGLFWRFMDVHRDFFAGNPRLGMLLHNLDKMSPEKKEGHFATAIAFLDKL